MKNREQTPTKKPNAEFIEGEHYYYEGGLMVLTAKFLRERGYCCGNGCRHCPYSEAEKAAYNKKSSSSL